MEMGGSVAFKPCLCFLQELALLPAEVLVCVPLNLLESCRSICWCLHSCLVDFQFRAMPGKPSTDSIGELINQEQKVSFRRPSLHQMAAKIQQEW